MATNEPQKTPAKLPSFMMSTATSKGKFPSTRTSKTTPSAPKTTPSAPKITPSAPKITPPAPKEKSSSLRAPNPSRPPSHTASKRSATTSKATPIPRPTCSPSRTSIKEPPKLEVEELTKWERLMAQIPEGCEVHPREKAEKPAKKEELWSLMEKGYHDVPDEPPKTWHILETMLSYKIRELREKWEVDCPDGLFWVTFKGRQIDPVTKDGKWMVRAKIRKSDKWMHAFLIKNPPTIERDYTLKPTDEVVWAIGDYDYWDVLPDW